jgi:hypothetical protein
MDLKKRGSEDVDWIHLAQITAQWWVLLSTAMNILLTEHHAMKAYCGSGGIAPRLLDFGTKRN